jgi:acyl carrier protein
MKDEKSVIPALIDFFRDELGVEPAALTVDRSLFKSGLLQSIDFIMTVAFLEEEFVVSIPSEMREADKMDTVAQIAELIGALKP